MKSHQWSGHAAWDLFPTEIPDVLWHGTSQCWLSLDVGQNPIWRICARFLLWELQNCNSLLKNHQQENVGSHQKRRPMLKGKGEAQQDDRCGEIAFRIKPHTCQRCLEGSNKTSCAPVPETPRDWARLPLSVSCEVRVSSGLPQRQGLWQQQTWEQITRHEAWVLLEEVTIAPP